MSQHQSLGSKVGQQLALNDLKNLAVERQIGKI